MTHFLLVVGCGIHAGSPTSLSGALKIGLTRQLAIKEVIFVGDHGMEKKADKQALGGAGSRLVTALTDPRSVR
jgi:hypothetical protein